VASLADVVVVADAWEVSEHYGEGMRERLDLPFPPRLLLPSLSTRWRSAQVRRLLRNDERATSRFNIPTELREVGGGVVTHCRGRRNIALFYTRACTERGDEGERRGGGDTESGDGQKGRELHFVFFFLEKRIK